MNFYMLMLMSCTKRDVHEARKGRVAYKADSKGQKVVGKSQKAS